MNQLQIPEEFDYIFYLNTNLDVKNAGFDTKEKAFYHWCKFGKKEGRKCNTFLKLPILIKNNYYQKINILLRNTYRPKSFEICMNSILQQNYPNLNIICCYDDDRCKDYLISEKFPSVTMNIFPIKIKQQPFHYNLYCNTLIEKIENGWFLFLDDDDKFTSNIALHCINSSIESNNDIIFWKFKRPDKDIYPRCISDIKPAQIASSTYCFHSNYKSLGKWKAHQLGDYDYINDVLLNHKFNRKFINYGLTGTSYTEFKLGNFGKKEE